MNKKDIKALQLVSRFSLPPNYLGFCGKDSAAERLKKCVISGRCENVEEELSHFITLYPYLKTISEIIGLSAFSYPVIESYWLGNEELKKAKPEHFELLLENFAKQGVPENTIAEFRKNKPKVFIPHHLFQVLTVSTDAGHINDCMIRWGKVAEISGEKVFLDIAVLECQKGDYKLKNRQEDLKFYPPFLPGLKAGDMVAVHWKQAVKILTKEEEKNLFFWTEKILRKKVI
ncbi:MAG: DUF6390 family protein [Patescibacteria group bacterium]